MEEKLFKERKHRHKMSKEHIRSSSKERIRSLYQVDPGFYRMIISRNPSLDKSSTRSSVYQSAANGKVPFKWEMEPGEPKFGAAGRKTSPTIDPPPAARGFVVPGPKWGATKNPNKRKNPRKRGIHIRLPRPRRVKSHLKNNIKKVKKIGHIGPIIRRGVAINKDKNKSSLNDRDDNLATSSSHGINLRSSRSFSPSFGDKSGTLLLKLWRLPKAIFK